MHSHGRFSQGGDKLIESLDPLEFLVITNTLPHRDANGQLFERQPGGKVSTNCILVCSTPSMLLSTVALFATRTRCNC
jgi:hypothetical protein